MTDGRRSSWNVAVWRRVLGIVLLSFSWIEGCQDNNRLCSYWASIGECKRNPNYMLYSCRKSCNACKAFGNSVKWPSGKYGLPMTKSGCPGADGFSWETGYIYQDLEDDKSLTAKSQNFHLNASVLSSGDVTQSFCFKTITTGAVDNGRFGWPYGQYCIYKKGSSCPGYLREGSVLWDDENGKHGINLNFKSGTVPAGTYKSDTEIRFCCQDVGSYSEPIELPIDKPFYLIAFNSKNCQEVLKTTHTLEYILYDTENDHNHNRAVYSYPFGADLQNPYIYYCYYQACRWTLTALNGSFSSPNYPSPYKEKAWCEWHINVPWNYIISLTFVDFRLETSDMCLFQSCDCDYVEIHDNFPNGTSELTGKYCMGVAYPPGDIRSKTNNVTVTFTSDGTVQDVGFKAEYHTLQLTIPTSTGRTTDTTQKATSTDITSVSPTTVPITGANSRGTTSGNDKSPTAGNTATLTSLSNNSKITTGTTITPAEESSTEQSTLTTRSSGHSTSQKASSVHTNPNGSFTSPFTNIPVTTLPITTDHEVPPRTRPHETTQRTSTSRVTSGELFPLTESRSKGEPSNSNGETEQKAEYKNSRASGKVPIIVALIASLAALAVVVTVALVCLRRNWRFKRTDKGHNKFTVSYTASEKIAEDDNNPPNMYNESFSRENERGERYTTETLTKKEQFNILYDNRDFMDSYDQFADDDEIKESDNPLYCSSIETGQDEKENILYESMDDVLQSVEEAECINPVYEGMV